MESYINEVNKLNNNINKGNVSHTNIKDIICAVSTTIEIIAKSLPSGLPPIVPIILETISTLLKLLCSLLP